MVKVEAIVREDKLEEVKDVLRDLKVHGMTISQVVGCGTSMTHTQIIRGSKVDITVVPKVKFEIVLSDQSWAQKTIDAIAKVAYTGEPGDGKIFVYPLTDVIRIRTGEHGPAAVWDNEQLKENEENEGK